MATVTFLLLRLVRDDVPAKNLAEGGAHTLRRLDLREKREAYAAKLQEEAHELGALLRQHLPPDGPPPAWLQDLGEELADVQEVLLGMLHQLGIPEDEVENLRQAGLAKPRMRFIDPWVFERRILARANKVGQLYQAAAPQPRWVALKAETAKLQQLLLDCGATFGLTEQQIRDQREEKVRQKGPFRMGYFMEELTLPLDHPLVDRYRREPERFPELGGSHA